MKPGGKGRLTPKTTDFSKELDKDLLGEVFSLRDISRHSQAKRIDPPIMSLVKLLKGSHVSLSSALCQSVVGGLWCLGFGCGHVCLFGQATQEPKPLDTY